MKFRSARWHCEFWEALGQTKAMQICKRETLNHQGAINHTKYEYSALGLSLAGPGSQEPISLSLFVYISVVYSQFSAKSVSKSS